MIIRFSIAIVSLRVLPWWTDVAVLFMEGFIQNLKNCPLLVFEFGGGNSTIWFSQNDLDLITVEHDDIWLRKIISILDGNPRSQGRIRQIEKGNRPYHAKFSEKLDLFNGKLLIVVVDGRDRVLCIEEVVRTLANLGNPHLLVLDNSERLASDYSRANEILSQNYSKSYHFEQQFCGSLVSKQTITIPDRVGWQAPHRWITSIFFSENMPAFTTSGAPLIAPISQ